MHSLPLTTILSLPLTQTMNIFRSRESHRESLSSLALLTSVSAQLWAEFGVSLVCIPRRPLSNRCTSDIIRAIADDANAAEVVKISEGQLYLVRSETIRSERECMYVAPYKVLPKTHIWI